MVAVEVRAADAVGDLPLQSFQPVMNGGTFAGVFGRFVEIRTTLTRPGSLESPVLYDLTIESRAIEVAIDIHPTSCPNPLNIGSKGVVPVAILGTDDLDVSLIDPETVMLEGVPALRHAWADVATPYDGDLCGCTTMGADGYPDLVLKFDAPALVAALGSVLDREMRPLTLTGFLLDGTPIVGADCVRIQVPAHRFGPPMVTTTADGFAVSWEAEQSDGFVSFAVFRGEADDFEPESPAEAIGLPVDPFFEDVDVPAGRIPYYRIGLYENVEVTTPDGNRVVEVFCGFSDVGTVNAPTGVSALSSVDTLSLAARPNPVRGDGEIVFALPRASAVDLAIYDVGGRLARDLVNDSRPAGRHVVSLDTHGLASGMYFVRLETEYGKLTRRVVVTR